MPLLASTITAKGQMTVPVEIRRILNLKPGDRVEFALSPDGRVFLRALNLPIEALFGALSHLTADPAYADDDDAIAAQVVAEDDATLPPKKRGRAA
jgi:AbrB family looped-hinge helix DNA binding protein